MCLSLSSIPKESWAVWLLFKEKHLLAVGQGWEGLGLEKTPRQPGLHKSLFWQQVPGLVQVAGPTEESELLLGLLVLSVRFGQDVGVSLTQAEQSKWKASWEVKITSTVIYRPLCSYCLLCVRWEGKNCRIRPRKTGLIEPTHHKEIISTVPVCTAWTKVWKRSVCVMITERVAELSRGQSQAVCCPRVLCSLHGQTSLCQQFWQKRWFQLQTKLRTNFHWVERWSVNVKNEYEDRLVKLFFTFEF